MAAAGPALRARRHRHHARRLLVPTPPRPPHWPPAKPSIPKRGEQKDSVLSAFDFAATRSKKDAELLWDAKYGKRSADGKMSPEQ